MGGTYIQGVGFFLKGKCTLSDETSIDVAKMASEFKGASELNVAKPRISYRSDAQDRLVAAGTKIPGTELKR